MNDKPKDYRSPPDQSQRERAAMVEAAEAARARRYGQAIQPHPDGTAKAAHYYAGFEDGWAALRSELSTARAELKDARMMLRVHYKHPRTTWFYQKADGAWLASVFALDQGRYTGGHIDIALDDDGTGLPVLTPAARRALEPEAHGDRGEREPKS